MGCHFLLQCVKVKVKSLSRVRLLATPWIAAYQAPPSMGFSRQRYWSGVPLPSPMVTAAMKLKDFAPWKKSYNQPRQHIQRRQWHPTPVLLPGKSHGWRSLVGCGPWSCYKSDMTEQLHFHALEKEMATHSSVLAWRIPGTGEPGGLPSMGSHRVRHD